MILILIKKDFVFLSFFAFLSLFRIINISNNDYFNSNLKF